MTESKSSIAIGNLVNSTLGLLQHHLTSLRLEGFKNLTEILDSAHFPLVEELVLGSFESLSTQALGAAFPSIRRLTLEADTSLRNGPNPFYSAAFPNLEVLRCYPEHLPSLTEWNVISPESLRGVFLEGSWDDDGFLDALKGASNVETLSLYADDIDDMASWQGFAESLPRLAFLSLVLPPMSIFEVRDVVRSAVSGRGVLANESNRLTVC